MDKQKQWVVLAVVGCLAVLAAGWFLLVSPKHAEAADLREQTVGQQQANAAARTKLAVLKAQAKDLPAEQAKIAAVAAKIPDNPALPALIRALDGASAESGVELLSIAPGTAAPVGPAVAGAVPGVLAPGLNSIPVSLQVAGGFFEVQQFVSGLEALPRALRVTNLVLATGKDPVKPAGSDAPGDGTADDGRALLATVNAQVYLSGAAPTAPATTAAGPTTTSATTAPTSTVAGAPAPAPAN